MLAAGRFTGTDDGRCVWKDASAQDELIQAWADLAKRFKGKKGIMFVPITEPHREFGMTSWQTPRL